MITSSSSRLAGYTVCLFASYFFLLRLTSRPSVEWAVVVSMAQWLIRRIFLIMPRMKCLCPYSASAMIGHAPSVERLYPSDCGQAWAPEFALWGVSTLIWLWPWVGRRLPELRGCFHLQIVVLHPVALRCYHYTFPVLQHVGQQHS